MDETRPSEMSPAIGCPLVLILLGVLGYLIWTFISMVVADFQSAPSAQISSKEEMSKEEMMATIINLSGNLCSKVIYVSPELSNGERQVNCEEYRDPSKSATKQNMVVYIVDMERNSVRMMGRT